MYFSHPTLERVLQSEPLMFFQIHKDGLPADGNSYRSLEEASAILEKAEQGGEVTEVDASDRILRRYTPQECRTAARKFRNEVSS